MFPTSHSSSRLGEQLSDDSRTSPETLISQEQRVRALEKEVIALQGLVCYLLEKNEYLRIRLRMI
jgi:hypothetical protein